jgi:hypothetical protein
LHTGLHFNRTALLVSVSHLLTENNNNKKLNEDQKQTMDIIQENKNPKFVREMPF